MHVCVCVCVCLCVCRVQAARCQGARGSAYLHVLGQVRGLERGHYFLWRLCGTPLKEATSRRSRHQHTRDINQCARAGESGARAYSPAVEHAVEHAGERGAHVALARVQDVTVEQQDY